MFNVAPLPEIPHPRKGRCENDEIRAQRTALLEAHLHKLSVLQFPNQNNNKSDSKHAYDMNSLHSKLKIASIGTLLSPTLEKKKHHRINFPAPIKPNLSLYPTMTRERKYHGA